jgi:hypothetical protein
MTDLSKMSDSELLAQYAMPSLIKQESGGRVGVIGPQTRYGRAEGMTQMLPATAQETAGKLGVPWRPELMRANTPEAAEYQETLGRAYLQEGIEKTGNLQDGLRYYHGGPDRKLWGPKTEAYAGQVSARLTGGSTPQVTPDLAGMSDDELMAMYKGGAPERISTSQNGGVTVDRIPQRPAPAAPVPQRTSIPLGVAKGVVEPYARLGKRGETPLTTAMLRGPGMFTPLGLGSRALDAASGLISAQERGGVKPSKGGQFAGNVLGSLPLAFAPGVGPAASGALTGALQSEGEGLGDVAKDIAFGAAAGKLGDKALKLVGSGVSGALSKAPKVMDLPALEGAVKAAYKRVDDSGFRLPSGDLQTLVKQVSDDLREKGGPKAARLFPDADALVSRLDALAKAKGGAKLTQLDTLRSDIYDVLVKPGGKEASIGKAMRAKIDELIDAVPNADIKGARDLYKRLSKTRTVTNKLEAADLQAGRAYTGKNVNNAIRQKLSPLVDPTSAQRIKNATPDEAAALRRAVVGSPAQNLVRSAGTMLDPRGIIGMGLQSVAGVKTAGLSLASVPLGLLATATGNRMSQKNVNELLRLIAVGGSKEALKKTPTTASRAAVKATSAARPAVTTAGAALAIQPPQKKRAK